MSVRIEYRVGVQATADALWDAIADLPAWPTWNPMYERAAGRIAFHETLELVELMPGAEPRKLTPRVTTWTPREQLVWLERRGFMSRSLRYFEIEELAPGGGCIFANGEMFLGPLGERRGKKMAGKLRAQFEAIGERLKAKVEAG